MRSPALLLPVLSAILACTGRPVGDTDGSTSSAASTAGTDPGSTSGTSTGSVSVTTTGAPTTGPASTTLAGTTEDPGTTDGPATTDLSATSSSSATTGTTDASTTGGPGDVAYAAQYYAGGLDRIFIRQADPGADLCTQLTLVWPGMPGPDLTLPDQWGVENTLIVQGTADCLDLNQPLMNAVSSDLAQGTATWDPGFCPKTLDLDVTLPFPKDQPWVPAQVVMQAAALPVQGC